MLACLLDYPNKKKISPLLHQRLERRRRRGSSGCGGIPPLFFPRGFFCFSSIQLETWLAGWLLSLSLCLVLIFPDLKGGLKRLELGIFFSQNQEAPREFSYNTHSAVSALTHVRADTAHVALCIHIYVLHDTTSKKQKPASCIYL